MKSVYEEAILDIRMTDLRCTETLHRVGGILQCEVVDKKNHTTHVGREDIGLGGELVVCWRYLREEKPGYIAMRIDVWYPDEVTIKEGTWTEQIGISGYRSL